MIRPFTALCMLMAGGSGLYLYQAKHQSQLLDREIARIVKQADATRERAGVLRAEYTLLNDPSRLAELASEALPDLKNTMPAQFTTWAELEKRLPPVGEPPDQTAPLEPDAPDAKLPPPAPESVPVAAAQPPARPEPKLEPRPEQLQPKAEPSRAPLVASAPPPRPAAPAHPVQQAQLPVARAALTPVSLTAPLTREASVREAPVREALPAPHAAPMIAARRAPPPAQAHATFPYVPPAYASPAYARPSYASAGAAPSGYATASYGRPAPDAPRPYAPPVAGPAPARLAHNEAPPPMVGSALGMARTMAPMPGRGAPALWQPGNPRTGEQ